MPTKSCTVQVKAAGPDDGLKDGQFRALVSVFGNKDSYGDIVMPGAFTDTLAEWSAKGDPIPIYWAHQMRDPDMCIGWVIEAKETDLGLEVLGQLDVDDDASPKARQVYRLLKGRRVTQFSFSYDIVEAAWVETDDEYWYELRKVKLYEVGPCAIGANQETELLAVKAAAEHAGRFAANIKAGRVLSVSAASRAALQEAKTSLDTVLTQITDVLAVVSEESRDEKAKTSEPAPEKSGAPMHASPSELSALLSIQLADAS